MTTPLTVPAPPPAGEPADDHVFLPLFCGGFGNEVGRRVRTKLFARPAAGPVVCRFVDSDERELKLTNAAGVPQEHTFSAGLTAERLQAIQYDPAAFGPYFVNFHHWFERFGGELNKHTLGTGANTMPWVGEYMFRANAQEYIRFLAAAVAEAQALTGPKGKVIPLLCGSGAGGTSHFALIYTSLLLGTAAGKRRSVELNPDKVDTPWWFVMPPRPQARSRSTQTFSDLILANAQAVCLESVPLAHFGAVRYICNPVESNSGRARAATVGAAAELLAGLLAGTISNWGTAQQDVCDLWDMRRDNPSLRGLRGRPAGPPPRPTNPLAWAYEFELLTR